VNYAGTPLIRRVERSANSISPDVSARPQAGERRLRKPTEEIRVQVASGTSLWSPRGPAGSAPKQRSAWLAAPRHG